MLEVGSTSSIGCAVTRLVGTQGGRLIFGQVAASLVHPGLVRSLERLNIDPNFGVGFEADRFGQHPLNGQHPLKLPERVSQVLLRLIV